jgi:hypothetical protein
MSAAALGAVGGLIGLGTDIASGYMATDAREDALNDLKNYWRYIYETMDPTRLTEIAKQGDVANYANKLANLRQNDPELAQIRQQGVQGLLGDMAEAVIKQDPNSKSLATLQKFQEEVASPQFNTNPLANSFFSKAQELLNRGSNLPPTFQGELVKAGLESAGATGVGANRTGPLAQRLGKLLGSAATQQEQLNLQSAAGAASAGNNLANSRMNMLLGLSSAITNLNSARNSLFAGGYGLANSQLAGLGGGLNGLQSLQLDEARRADRNKQQSALADLSAAAEINDATGDINTLTSVGNWAKSGFGMTGGLGGAGGASGGASGGFGSGGIFGTLGGA